MPEKGQHRIDDTAVKGLSMDQAVKRMRGKAGTQITLTLLRKGEAQPIVVTLTRAEIQVQSVKSKLVEPGFAWVRISQFQEKSPEDLARHVGNDDVRFLENLDTATPEGTQISVIPAVAGG